MIFKKKAGKPNQTGEPKKARKESQIDPNLWARRTWDYQIIRSYKWTKFLMITTIASIGLSVFSVFFAFSQAEKPKMLPYVVTIEESGDVQFRGMVNARPLEINDAVVRHYLIRFISNLRQVSSDAVVLRESLQDVYRIATSSAQNQLTSLIREEGNPLEMHADELRRDIEINLFEKVSQNTWRVEWIEEIRQQGVLRQSVPMTGTFTYTRSLPETELQAEMNPFGLYFTEFYLSQRRR